MEDKYISTSASTSFVLFTIFFKTENAKNLCFSIRIFMFNDEIHNVD